MTLGDILMQAVKKDLAWNNANGISYSELVADGKFIIKFSSSKFKEATIECSVPYSGKQEEENYARLYFLSMAFNAAILGMKREKNKNKKR
jgi:hypothetical protein